MTKLSDGEISVDIWETVGGLDVCVVQSTCNPVNDDLMELLIMIDAMKRASAGRINAIISVLWLCTARQKSQSQRPDHSEAGGGIRSYAAGADRVLSMDLHPNQIQGYFDIPVDHLLGMPILREMLQRKEHGRSGHRISGPWQRDACAKPGRDAELPDRDH